MDFVTHLSFQRVRVKVRATLSRRSCKDSKRGSSRAARASSRGSTCLAAFLSRDYCDLACHVRVNCAEIIDSVSPPCPSQLHSLCLFSASNVAGIKQLALVRI